MNTIVQRREGRLQRRPGARRTLDSLAPYEQVYGDRVLDIEYTDNLPRTFAAMCADEASRRSMVLRDRDLEPAGSPGHVARVCP